MMHAVWTETRRFVALEHDFGVRSEDRRLTEQLDWAFADLAAPGEARSWYSITGTPDDPPHSYEVAWNDEIVAQGVGPGKAMAWVQWDANRRASASVSGLVLHAGAVATPAGAVIIPGRSGAGKSTLVALLTRQGFGYLTDEAVVLEGPDWLVRPYPKPLALGPESIELLELEAELPEPFPDADHEKRLVPSRLLRERSVAAPCPPVGVVLFDRAESTPPDVVGVTRATLVAALAADALSFADQPRQTVDALVDLAGTITANRFSAPDSVGITELVTAHFS